MASSALLDLKAPAYSPGGNLPAQVHPVPRIWAPGFDERCQGIPPDWTYKASQSWGERTVVALGKRARGMKVLVPEGGQIPEIHWEKVTHLRHFLAIRPLSRGWEAAVLAAGCALDEHGDIVPEGVLASEIAERGEAVDRVPNVALTRPTLLEAEMLRIHADVATNIPSICCADLLDWERIEEMEGDKAGHYRIPYLPESELDQKLTAQDPETTRVWRRAVHGTSVQALYSILYHGKIKTSSDVSRGEGFLEGYPGVYTHNIEDWGFSKGYATYTSLGIPGLYFQVMVEVARKHGTRAQFPDNLGANKKQCVNKASDVKILALWLSIKTMSQFKPDQDWVFVGKSKQGWDAMCEANPLKVDVYTQGVENEPVGDEILESAPIVRDIKVNVGIVASIRDSIAKALSGSSGAVSSETAEGEATIVEDKVVKEEWENHARHCLRVLQKLMPEEVASLMNSAATYERPIEVLQNMLCSLGDINGAAWLNVGIEMALTPEKDPLTAGGKLKGTLTIVSDSTLKLRGTDSYDCSRYIVHQLKQYFEGASNRVSCRSFSSTTMIGEQSQGSLWDTALTELKDKNDQLAPGLMTVPFESGDTVGWKIEDPIDGDRIRPRILVMVWMLNEAVDKDWNVIPCPPDGHDTWITIEARIMTLVEVFDRSVCILGAHSSAWGLDAEFDKWIEKATKILSRHGVIVIDGINLIRKCVLASDGKHLAGDSASVRGANREAITEYIMNAYRLAYMTTPAELSYDQNIDLMRPEGGWMYFQMPTETKSEVEEVEMGTSSVGGGASGAVSSVSASAKEEVAATMLQVDEIIMASRRVYRTTPDDERTLRAAEKTAALFPSWDSWQLERSWYEQQRLRTLNQIHEEYNGHVASMTEMEFSGHIIRPAPKGIFLEIIRICRMKARFLGMNLDRSGWIDFDDVLKEINKTRPIPISKAGIIVAAQRHAVGVIEFWVTNGIENDASVPRAVPTTTSRPSAAAGSFGVVSSDDQQRRTWREVWRGDDDEEGDFIPPGLNINHRFPQNFTHIRASCGHYRNMRVDPNLVMGRGVDYEFRYLRDVPSVVYHGTDLPGWSRISLDGKIKPGGGATHGRTLIHMSVFPPGDERNPTTFEKSVKDYSICIVIDLHHAVAESIPMSYATNGDIVTS